jgi:hypothetical protein
MITSETRKEIMKIKAFLDNFELRLKRIELILEKRGDKHSKDKT